MCTDAQHKQKMEVLTKLREIAEGRPRLDSLVLMSASQAYVLDYRARRHIFLWSATTLTLTLEDLGDITISQWTWTNIGFTTGMKIYASGQATPVPVFIRCTDETVA